MPGGPVRARDPAHPGGAVELLVVRQAARRWHIDPRTLWGVYGTETSFGENIAVSSAGAKGPFQFIDSTARRYGVNVMDFTSSAFGAAHYLHDLGADGDVNSAATAHALNQYSGGGGADYVGKVKSHGGGVSGHDNPAGNALAAVGDAGSAVVNTATAIPQFLGKLGGVIFNSNFWLRVGMILGGIVALSVGLVFIGQDFTPIGAVTKAIGK